MWVSLKIIENKSWITSLEFAWLHMNNFKGERQDRYVSFLGTVCRLDLLCSKMFSIMNEWKVYLS